MSLEKELAVCSQHVKDLRFFDIQEIGSMEWCKQNAIFEKLNMKAGLCLLSGNAETVSDALIEHQKLEMLIKQLKYMMAWRSRVFPFVKSFLMRYSWPFTYTLIQHVGTIFGLLQTTFYKKDSIDAADDAIMDLIDMIAQQLAWLLSWRGKKITLDSKLNINADDGEDSEQEFERKVVSIEWRSAWIALACLCHITHHIKIISISAITRMIDQHELINNIILLLEARLWERKREFEIDNGLVNEADPTESQENAAKKAEGILWITLFNLLSNISYKINPSRKEILLKLLPILDVHKHLHEQFSFLEWIQRSVLHLSMSDSDTFSHGSQSRSLSRISCLPCFEVPHNIDCEKISRENIQMWKSSKIDSYTAHLLSSVYQLEDLEELSNFKKKCGNCGAPAEQRCGNCRAEFYCCRECQAKAWATHKKYCFANTNKK